MNSDLEFIEKLAIDRSQASADKLQELERITTRREIRKAARKALYTLSLAGILPSKGHPVGPGEVISADRVRAFASAFDGAGNRLILFLVPDPDGGSATLLQILTNDTEGVKDCESLKLRRRDLDTRIEAIKLQVETGLAVAEIEPDYGRRLLANARSLTASLSKRSPASVLAWLVKIGEPVGDTAEEHAPPIYSHITEKEIRDDASIPKEPAELFALKWFDAWFFAAEDAIPWLSRWEKASADAGEAPASEPRTEIDQIVKEAASFLMTDSMRALYICRLEETADVLWRCGKESEAKQAFYHAVILKNSVQEVSEIPFVRSIAMRTLGAAFEMVRDYRERRASG